MEQRTTRVKNRAPAPIQITAEQLLREAADNADTRSHAPRQRIADYEELNEFRGRKRREFEETIRRTRQNISAWIKYAYWEATQKEYARSRSVYERALDVDPADVKLWLSYTEMELKARNVAHARNLFDRAVTLLPRIDQIWYKYVYLEELLGNVAGARQVFERWMQWEPNDKAWAAYIKLETRYSEFDRASAVYERLTACHPEPKIWVKWAKFEEDRQNTDKARQVFQMAMEYFGEDEDMLEKSQSIYTAFAKMEIRAKEYDRARAIYKYVLERLPRSKSAMLFQSYSNFEKQFGDKSGIEDTVLGKRRIEYEDTLTHEPHNYDVWTDYCRLEEDVYRSLTQEEDPQALQSALDRVRDVYERAIAQKPPGDEKRYWRRYIFLWLNYALFEEIDTQDYDRTRQIFEALIKMLPHKKFTFAKVWTLYAQFEVRRLNLDKARKIMGTAIGMCPKEKLFKNYIELELQLREFDRCRKLYEQYLTHDASNATAFIKFAELEHMLGDYERARAIYELAISQSTLDMPELLWKSYIDYEFTSAEFDRTRELYERLLEKTSHVKVWISYAQFEVGAGKALGKSVRGLDDEDDEDEEEVAEKVEKVVSEEDEQAAQQLEKEAVEKARAVFDKAYKALKNQDLKQERLVLLEAWKAMEQADGDETHLAKVETMMPRVVKKRRAVDEDGSMEEYYDLLFADDEQERNPASFKLLQMAHAWKAQKLAESQKA